MTDDFYLAKDNYLEQSNLTLTEELIEARILGTYINVSTIFNHNFSQARAEYNDNKEAIKPHDHTSTAVEDLYLVFHNGKQVFNSHAFKSWMLY